MKNFAANGFVGEIEGLSLVDLVQFACLSGDDRKLSVLSSDDNLGVLYFSDNEIIHAEFGELTGEEAFFRIMSWPSGTFSMLFDKTDQRTILAISYNINIVTGSMPALREEKLYNVGFLCRRNGTYETYEKIHVTPDEAKWWGLSGGNTVEVFETDCGPVGVLICYDVEFPELPRILAQQGMNILFVPFLTDTQNGYSRVRYCARARAIENECYVVIAGSVGNLPKVENMDIQFAQSVVFTPSDFSFPANGIKAEATANTEMILVADCDLDLLKELHTFGAVRNLKDRRTDLYSVCLNKEGDNNCDKKKQ